MITVNTTEIKYGHFPDGTISLKLYAYGILDYYDEKAEITWNYEKEEELIVLIYIVNWFREKAPGKKLLLYMPYIPNARMDRTKHLDEVFTLKYFANIINSLNFAEVHVSDPHSDVSVALLNNVIKDDRFISSIGNAIKKVYENISRNADIEKCAGPTHFALFFPDRGAQKRYMDIITNPDNSYLFSDKEHWGIYCGEKERVWETGEIKGIKIIDGKTGEKVSKIPDDTYVLMIDDIISYGGTLSYSAIELQKLGASEIYAYATHTERSVLDKEHSKIMARLADGDIKKLYTTSSIFKEEWIIGIYDNLIETV